MPPLNVATLDTPLIQLWGVGQERAAQLGRLGLRTVGDLLRLQPRRYEDRRHFLAIRDLQLGQPATTRGRIVAQGTKTFRDKSRSLFECILDDGSARLHCRWWNLAFMEKYFAVGDDVMVYGKPVSLKPRSLDHPETEILETGEESSIHLDRVVPIYPLTEGLGQRWLRSLIWRTVAAYEKHLSGEDHPPLPSLAQAIRWLHFPDETPQAEEARKRLALDELTALQLAIQTRRRNLQTNAQGLPCAGTNRLMKPLLARLGFSLTNAQTSVLREIRNEMGGPHPMRRLLQGDVGSGKTVVAACTGLMALESGFNVALMAPTEILAEQHFRTFEKWFGPLGIAVRLRTGSTDATSQENPAPDSATGRDTTRPRFVIGTHALIEPGFEVPNLGLVIIDEQHRFGVVQRETLLRKGRYPHLLVMTATPIPRTLGLTLYGDLDISVIREMPPGRGRVRTFVRNPARLPQVSAFIRKKIAEGRQAYVVYPRIEDSDLKSGAKAVKQEYERLSREFAPHRVGLLHGRLRPDQKDEVMAAFRNNEINVLLTTSVIEVGVDVPNATVMLIENAEQFGLAQLHQLRGRIGRGAHESYCVLVPNRETPEARQRLHVLEESTDGFRIAEADLEMRGPGELLGQNQSGLPSFRFARLAQDRTLVEMAGLLATKLLNSTHTPPAQGGISSQNLLLPGESQRITS